MIEKLDLFLDEYCKLFQFSGALRITHKGNIIYQRFMGYADYEAKSAINEYSMFTLYSISKPFCALGLLKLKDQGKVNLEAHPGIYVPEAKGFDKRVTIRHMLHHVSGLPDFFQNKDFAAKYQNGPTDKMREQLRLLAQYPMCFEPGKGAMYANVNFILCALIIENVSGMKYDEYMKKEVFIPLGMKTAQVDHEGLIVQNRVKGYEINGKELEHVDRSLDWMFGAGDIIGTLDDVYCLNKAIKNRWLLKEETWEEVLRPSPLNQMGMGCFVNQWHGKQRISHTGGHKGFRTLHIQLPEDDFDIILLSNSGYGNSRNAISEAVYRICYGEDNSRIEQLNMDEGYVKKISTSYIHNNEYLNMPLRISLDVEEEKEILGKYGPYNLQKVGENYSIINENGKELHCYPIGNNTFMNLYIDERYTLVKGANGVMNLLGYDKQSNDFTDS